MLDSRDTDSVVDRQSRDTGNRDSSTMRLRQLIAFKQQANRKLDDKEEKMLQKLKPYFNRFRITTYADNGHKPLTKVRRISDQL